MDADDSKIICDWRSSKIGIIQSYQTFQAEVQRLEVSGSVALGGAIRAAQHGMIFH